MLKTIILIAIVALSCIGCKKEDGPKHDPYNHDHPLATADLAHKK